MENNEGIMGVPAEDDAQSEVDNLLPRLLAVEGIVFRFQGQKGEEDHSICREAAAEITRLREALAARDERINELEMREEALWYEMKERD